MGYKYSAVIEQDIKEWVEAITSLDCVQEDAKYENPEIEGDFTSYDLGSPRMFGEDSRSYDSGDNFKYQGVRALSVTVTIYANNALKLISDLQSSLGRDTILQGFNEKGFSILSIQGTQNVTALLDTGYERRAVLDFTIGVNETMLDETSYIKTVEQQGIALNEEGTEVYNEEITIN